ncbi:MAG: hypothetical protein BWY64_03237 [bacterium ADurb.Bin363]|nr:MAG: hypothetical protein BWY64_03237 [bacterium ADurb.Bin363]
MEQINLKQRLLELIELLSENKLHVLVHFASYLKEKEDVEEILRLQTSSTGYKEWLSTENDIYDEVFNDEIQ